jgi:hypothetical protein
MPKAAQKPSTLKPPSARARTSPPPCPIRHTTGQESRPESTANPTGITAPVRPKISGSSPRKQDRIGTRRRQGRATPRRGQQPNLTAKRKTSRRPRQPGAPAPQPSPTPGSLALAAQKRQGQLLCSTVGIAGTLYPGHLSYPRQVEACRWWTDAYCWTRDRVARASLPHGQ